MPVNYKERWKLHRNAANRRKTTGCFRSGAILAPRKVFRKKPGKKPSLMRSVLAVIMGLLLLGLAVQAVFGPTGQLEMNRLEEEIETLVREKEALESGNRQVMGEIESLKTDPATIEKIAREELGLVREGEIKIVTKLDSQDSPGAAAGGDDSAALPGDLPPQQTP